MPELPEVETVINALRPKIINKRLTSFTIFWDRTLYTSNIRHLKQTIENNLPTINSIERHGKYIILSINQYYLVCHLRMTGYLYYSNNINKESKHIRCFFQLNDNAFIVYEDIRKFGGFYFLQSLDDIYKKTGLDPINDNYSFEWLHKNINNRKKMIKSLLLDQKFICGIGNIYADEILWLSKIHPETAANKISKKKIKLLYINIQKVLLQSIQHHGTTIINFKFDNMKTGNYKQKLMAYGRENKSCKSCLDKKIIKIKVCSRSTFICELCQKH